jgi:hypothetical protein
MTTTGSKEVKALVGGFLTQVRGIFSGLEKLPGVYQELEDREAVLEAQELRRETLAAEIASLSATIADLTDKRDKLVETVRKQTAAEELKQRTEMNSRRPRSRAKSSPAKIGSMNRHALRRSRLRQRRTHERDRTSTQSGLDSARPNSPK